MENRLIVFYKGLNKKANIPIRNEVSDKITRNTRRKHQKAFNIPLARTNVYKFSFLPRTIVEWNRLTDKTMTAANSAKNRIRTFSTLIKSAKST